MSYPKELGKYVIFATSGKSRMSRKVDGVGNAIKCSHEILISDKSVKEISIYDREHNLGYTVRRMRDHIKNEKC